MTINKRDNLINWIYNNAIILDHLDPKEPFDDLEPLREIIGNSRVVALGENSHFIEEFCLFRHRIIRFLVEKCGFTVYGMEFGFTEGYGINDWIHGNSKESSISNLLSHFPYPSQIHNTFHWMRDYNQHKNAIDFIGIDVPRNGGSFFPSLEIVRDFLSKADTDALPLVSEVYEIASKVNGYSTAQSAFLLNQLSTVEKLTLTATLSRLQYRLEALEPQHITLWGKELYKTIYWHLKSICYLNYNSHAMNGLIAGNALPGDMGVRDKFMADSVLWHLNNKPNSKIVLSAHNAHIQKTPIKFGEFLSCLPMGQRLSYELGKDYFSLGITSTSGNTAALYPDEKYKYGFRIENTPLESPVSDSIEFYLNRANIKFGLLGFQGTPRNMEEPKKIRFDSEFIETSILDAFDGIFIIPTSNVAKDV